MPSFADFLTPAGAIIAAGVVTTLVDLLRRAIPPIAGWNGATLAFGLSWSLYIVTAIATNVATLDAALAVFLAWLSCATSAVGIKATVRTLKGD